MRSHVGIAACCLAAIAMLALPAPAGTGDRQADYIQLRLLVGEQRFSEALERCRVLIATYPDYVYLYETLPEIALYAQELEGAAQFFEQRIDDGTCLELSYFGLGTVYFNMGAYREAALCFDRAIELGITAPECYRNFVYAFERLEGVDASIRFFNSLCHRDPKNPHFWYAAALAYWSKKDYPTVLKNLEEALSRNPNEPKYLQAKAAVLVLAGRTKQSACLLARMLEIANQGNDFAGIQFLTSYYVLSQDREGVPSLENSVARRGLEDAKRFGQFRWIGWWHERLANIEYSRAIYKGAIQDCAIAFQASRMCQDNRLALDALIRQIESSVEIGSYDVAIESAYKELQVSKEDKDIGRTARSLNDLAWIFHELGLDDISMEYAVEALGLIQNSNAGNEVLMRIYATLGLIYARAGNYELALANLNASDQLIPKGGVWLPHRAVSHGNIGRLLMKLGQLDAAEHHFTQELSLARIAHFAREESYAINNLADVYARRGKTQFASRLYLKAFKLSQEFDQKPTQTTSALAMANLAAKGGRRTEAVAWYKRAFEIAESMSCLWQGYLSGGETRVPFDDEAREYAVLLLSIGDKEEAFNFLEKWRLLTRPPQLSYTRMENECTSLPDSTKQFIHNFCRQPDRFGTPGGMVRKRRMITESQYDLNEFEKSILSNVGFQRILSRIAKEDSVTFRTLCPRPATLAEVQQTLVTSNQAVLEYLVGQESTLVLLVQKDSVHVVHLGIGSAELRKLIERVANVFSRDERSYVAMSASFANFNFGACVEAYERILKPVLDVAPSIDELTIVPDDVLRGLAFECLIKDNSDDQDYSKARFVVQTYAVRYALSMTSLLPRCKRPCLADGNVLAIANPDMNSSRSAPDEGGTPGRAFNRHSFGLPPLPGAEEEAKSIEMEFGDGVTVLRSSKATKGRIKALLSSYKIVHVAAHATIDAQHPMASSIYLAPDSGSLASGILSAYDLLESNITAEMVVLSSCNTVRYSGDWNAGGFVEALEGAGIPSIVGSLWSADDNSSALVMRRFYHYLGAGERKDKALQRAKLDLIHSGKADPFYWASFILIGDGSAVSFGREAVEDPQRLFIYAFFGMIGLCSILGMVLLCKRSVSDLSGCITGMQK